MREALGLTQKHTHTHTQQKLSASVHACGTRTDEMRECMHLSANSLSFKARTSPSSTSTFSCSPRYPAHVHTQGHVTFVPFSHELSHRITHALEHARGEHARGEHARGKHARGEQLTTDDLRGTHKFRQSKLEPDLPV